MLPYIPKEIVIFNLLILTLSYFMPVPIVILVFIINNILNQI